MRIRHIDVDPPLILAPMEGVTDLTFRRLVRQIGGCGLTVTEFIPARGLGEDHARCREMARFDEDERPVAIQVFGRDPETLAEGAAVVEALGADIVDLNMGCPSKKVCSNSGGSALMREPELARDIVRAMRRAVSIPFTVKMRAGWDPEHRNAPEIAWMCQEEGVEAVTVHWRTRADLYGGERELETIRTVKERLSIPVVANGDVIDVASAREMFAATGCDAVMIGRGAIRDPWVFERIRRDLQGLPPLEVSPDEKERVLIGYFDAVERLSRNERGALGRMKKIARYFTEGLPEGGATLRTAILHSDRVDEARERVAVYFEGLRTTSPAPGPSAAP